MKKPSPSRRRPVPASTATVSAASGARSAISAAPRTASSKPFYASFGFQVLAAMVIGLLLGLAARNMEALTRPAIRTGLRQTLSTVGSIFVQLLQTLVPPLIFTAIVASIGNLRQLSNAAALVWQTLLWFAITALIAVLIGIALGLIIQPGLNAAVLADAAKEPSTTGSWLDFLKGLVPGQRLRPAGLDEDHRRRGDHIAQLQRAADPGDLDRRRRRRACGSATRAKTFLAFNESLLAVVRKILWWVIRLTPIGTIGLLGNAVAQYGWDDAGAARLVRARRLYRPRDRAAGRLPGAADRARPVARRASSPAPGRRSSSPSCRARRSAPCR